MKWHKGSVYENCSVCGDWNIWLNDYGVCADCWSKLPEERRATLAGGEREQVRVVTYRVPAYPGAFRRLASSAVGSAVGFLAAVHVARWFGWL